MKGLATETVPRGHICQLEFPWALYLYHSKSKVITIILNHHWFVLFNL